MKYLAFDIEVCSWPEDKETPWQSIAPLGISCVGLMGTGWDEPQTLFAGMNEGHPEPRGMNYSELFQGMAYIFDYIDDEEYCFVGWNSLQFDLACVYEEFVAFAKIDSMIPKIKKLAMNHVDPLFEIFCTFGWPVGLDAVAHGLGLPGKMKDGVSGAEAPAMWMNGTDDDRWTVLEYVGKDAIATLDIVEVGTRTNLLKWNSKKGRPYSMKFSNPKTVTECLLLPEKDTSWMDKPLYRKDFYEWTQK